VWSCISSTPVLINPVSSLDRRLSEPHICLGWCNERKISDANWRWIPILCSTSLYPSHYTDWSTQTIAIYRPTCLWYPFKKHLVSNITYSMVPINSILLTVTLHHSVIMTHICDETQSIRSLSWHCNWV